MKVTADNKLHIELETPVSIFLNKPGEAEMFLFDGTMKTVEVVDLNRTKTIVHPIYISWTAKIK